MHLHCHYVGGMAPANYLKAAEAGVSIVDTASAPLAFGNSQPAVEMIVAALQESRYDTGLDLDLLFEIAEYWEEVRKRSHYKRGVSSLIHMQVYSHQVPGGMMSNLMSQLEVQNASDRLPEVMKEIPRVRAEVGYPPLVTPMSQIVGTQAVFNVLTGKRWGVVSKEMKDYICGYYGKAPGRIDPEIMRKVAGNSQVLPDDVPPSSLVTTTYDEVAEEVGDLAQSEEDVLMYALFPNEARTFLSKHRASEKVDFLHAGGVQQYQGGRLRGYQSDSRIGSRCRGKRRRRDRGRGRRSAHRRAHARRYAGSRTGCSRSGGRRRTCSSRSSTCCSGRRCRRARASRQLVCREGPHGWHVLRRSRTGRARVREGGRRGCRQPDPVHRRGHEAHERDHRRGDGHRPRGVRRGR